VGLIEARASIHLSHDREKWPQSVLPPGPLCVRCAFVVSVVMNPALLTLAKARLERYLRIAIEPHRPGKEPCGRY